MNRRSSNASGRRGWQQTWVRVLLAILVLNMMALIFNFSAEDASQSNRTSASITEKVAPLVIQGYREMPPRKRVRIFNTVQTIVRKCAHFIEYFLLGLVLRCCMESWIGGRKRLPLIAWLFGAAYAASDEAHQLWVDGRGGQLTDVLLDSCGVLTGVLFAMLLIRITKNRMGS